MARILPNAICCMMRLSLPEPQKNFSGTVLFLVRSQSLLKNSSVFFIVEMSYAKGLGRVIGTNMAGPLPHLGMETQVSTILKSQQGLIISGRIIGWRAMGSTPTRRGCSLPLKILVIGN